MSCFCSTRGQILPVTALRNCVDVELIYEGYKYIVTVTKVGVASYFLAMNDSCIDLDAHRLTDGGLLLSLDGDSYTTYMKVRPPFI